MRHGVTTARPQRLAGFGFLALAYGRKPSTPVLCVYVFHHGCRSFLWAHDLWQSFGSSRAGSSSFFSDNTCDVGLAARSVSSDLVRAPVAVFFVSTCRPDRRGRPLIARHPDRQFFRPSSAAPPWRAADAPSLSPVVRAFPAGERRASRCRPEAEISAALSASTPNRVPNPSAPFFFFKSGGPRKEFRGAILSGYVHRSTKMNSFRCFRCACRGCLEKITDCRRATFPHVSIR